MQIPTYTARPSANGWPKMYVSWVSRGQSGRGARVQGQHRCISPGIIICYTVFIISVFSTP